MDNKDKAVPAGSGASKTPGSHPQAPAGKPIPGQASKTPDTKVQAKPAAATGTSGGIRTQLKSKWSKLTDAELTKVEAHHDALSGILVKSYGLNKEQADKDSKAFMAANHC